MSQWDFSVYISKPAVQPFQQAEACLQKGDMPGAIASLTQVIRIEGQSDAAAYAYYLRGSAYHGMGSIQQAIENWTQSLNILPKAMVYMDRAHAWSTLGNYDSAISDITKVIDLDPTRAEAYNRRGLYHSYKQDFNKAVADYSRAIGIESQKYVFYLNRGRARQNLGDLENALFDYNQAVRLEPGDADNYYYRSSAYRSLEKYEEALKDLDEAVRLDPNDVYHFDNRGHVRLKLGDFGGAISDFNEAIRIQPSARNQIEPHIATAYIRRSLGFKFSDCDPNYDIGDALTDAQSAILIQPNSAIAYYASGRLLYIDDMRNFVSDEFTESAEDAIEDFTTAIQLASDFAEPYANRADLYLKYGYYREAFEDMKMALRLKPKHSDWLFDMQMIVNALADDGYTSIDEPIVGLVFGKPGYDREIEDWDDYLQWRLKTKNQSISATQNAIQNTVPAKPSNPNNQAPKQDSSTSHPPPKQIIDKEGSDRFQDMGLAFKREGNYLKSKNAYYRAIELNHTDSMAYYGLAKTCYLNQDRREAIVNYLATLHLSLGYMIQSLNEGQEMIKFQRSMVENLLGKETLSAIRSVSPYADLLWLDENTPLHLTHAFIDLDPLIKKSKSLTQYIERYGIALSGKKIKPTVLQSLQSRLTLTASQDELEKRDTKIDQHYLQLGRKLAYQNLNWGNLANKDPYKIYSVKDELLVGNIREWIANLP